MPLRQDDHKKSQHAQGKSVYTLRNITNRIAVVFFSLARVQVAFGGINERNIGTLKLLNETILPVRYSNKVYDEILTTPKEFTKFGAVAYSAHCVLFLYAYVEQALCVIAMFPARSLLQKFGRGCDLCTPGGENKGGSQAVHHDARHIAAISRAWSWFVNRSSCHLFIYLFRLA